LPKEVIQRVIRRQVGAIKACYERALQRIPGLEGTVKVQFVIGLDGAVPSASDAGSSMPDREVVSCVVGVLRRTSFPKPDGGIVTVTYPFTFKAAD
jgi:TonB family protein